MDKYTQNKAHILVSVQTFSGISKTRIVISQILVSASGIGICQYIGIGTSLLDLVENFDSHGTPPIVSSVLPDLSTQKNTQLNHKKTLRLENACPNYGVKLRSKCIQTKKKSLPFNEIAFKMDSDRIEDAQYFF